MTTLAKHSALSAQELVDLFALRLRERGEDLARISSFWNAFEGWLKWELAAALCAGKWDRRPWSDDSQQATWDTVGVEYKVPLETRAAASARKQVDLWVCGTRRESWHYVELKVAFANANALKQIASWRTDLALLKEVVDPGVEGRIVLLVAVGFETDRLKELVGAGATVTPLRDASHAGTRDATPSVHLVAALS